VAASKTFSVLDDYMWKLIFKWAKHNHPKKSSRWTGTVNRHYGEFNKFRNDRWVFGERELGAYLPNSPGIRTSPSPTVSR
jgi:RNA-directed DNA polymerase